MATPVRVECVPRGALLNVREGETILDAALREGVPLASSCGGHAVCGDCLVRPVRGAAALPAPDGAEAAWRARKGYAGDARLACRVAPTHDCAVATSYW